MPLTPYTAHSIASFFEYEGDTLPFERLVACGVGYDGTFYGVISLRTPELRKTASNGVSYSVTRPTEKNQLRIFAVQKNQVCLDLYIEESFNIHYIQPLPNGLLLASGRAQGADSQKNGRVYDLQGECVDEIMLGDGIQDIQTTKEGDIWVSYFDEGIFGDCPLARHGLVQFDRTGQVLYTLDQPHFSDMADCYALNIIETDNIWFYYYTPFDLVNLKQGKIHRRVSSPVKGASCFAVLGDFIVLNGGYNQPATKMTVLQISPKGDVSLKNKIEIDLALPKRFFVIARKNHFYYILNKEIYQISLEDLLGWNESE